MTITIVINILCYAMADSFDKIKTNLSQNGCCLFEFISIVESDIFELVDSTYGTAYLASDGRYKIDIGDDQYINNLKELYTFSKSNNQVVIEKATNGIGEEISFITKLDDIYETNTIKADYKYLLIKRQNISGDYQDSLIIFIDNKKPELKQIEYYDVNEELNKIIFLNQSESVNCNDKQFEPSFPDSVEKVRL